MIKTSESLTQYGFGTGGEFDPRTSLKHILGKPFTLKAIRDTPFDDSPEAVTVSTKEDHHVKFTKKTGETVDGDYHEFYATWKVVIDRFKNPKLREDLANGVPIPRLKLVSKPSKKRPGSEYYDIVPA